MSCPIGESAAGTAIAPSEREGLLLDELYRQQAEYFGRVAFLLTDSAEQAEELVQEAFSRLAGRWREVRDPRALKCYLRRTIVNLAINGYRKRDNERAYLRRWAQAHEILETQPDIETRHELLDVLRSLPARQRAVVVLKYYEDLTEREIAEALRCPLGTVKSSLWRALAAMKVNLEGERDE